MGKETQGERQPRSEAQDERDPALRESGWLRCVACGQPIARDDARIAVDGRHVHTFVNPAGHEYTIGCFAEAPGCVGAGEEESFWTWFPGHVWRMALCSGCGTHLGWSFRARESGFWGLTVQSVR
jgi:hypothetical protein